MTKHQIRIDGEALSAWKRALGVELSDTAAAGRRPGSPKEQLDRYVLGAH